MNRFLTPLSNAILDRKGTIDKYMGDAIMAFWNAPLDDHDHEINACEAALDMLERDRRTQRAARQEADEEAGTSIIPLKIGIGINTGDLRRRQHGLRHALRLFGARRQREPRLAPRRPVQGIRHPDHRRLRTALAVKERFAILELDFVMVKGKQEPEVIYAIVGREDVAQSGAFQRLRNLTIEMLACYRSRDWEGALAAIERGRKTDDAHSLERLYDLYEKRIRGYVADPPPPDWNGAYALLTK